MAIVGGFIAYLADKMGSKIGKKKMSVELARKNFPELSDILIASKDGRAEALLMALYGKQKYDEQISKC